MNPVFLFLLVLAPSIVNGIRPKHSWDTLSSMSFIHLCNETGLFSDRWVLGGTVFVVWFSLTGRKKCIFELTSHISKPFTWSDLASLRVIVIEIDQCDSSLFFSFFLFYRAMDTIAKFPLVTIEKGQGFNDTNCSQYGPGVTFPCAEEKIVEQCTIAWFVSGPSSQYIYFWFIKTVGVAAT